MLVGSIVRRDWVEAILWFPPVISKQLFETGPATAGEDITAGRDKPRPYKGRNPARGFARLVLAEDDFLAVAHYATGGVAGVDYQLGGVDDGGVVVAGMVGGDDYAVVAGQGLWVQGHGLHVFVVVVAHLVELGEIGIVVVEFGATLLEELHDLERG